MDRVHVSELRQYRNFAPLPSLLKFFTLPDRPETLRGRGPDHPFSHSHAHQSEDAIPYHGRGSGVEVEVRDVA